jgi:hypothetical protein
MVIQGITVFVYSSLTEVDHRCVAQTTKNCFAFELLDLQIPRYTSTHWQAIFVFRIPPTMAASWLAAPPAGY